MTTDFRTITASLTPEAFDALHDFARTEGTTISATVEAMAHALDDDLMTKANREAFVLTCREIAAERRRQ